MIEATIKKVSPIETEVAQPSTVTMELKPLSNGGGSSFSVLFVEQELTDEQKAQARANIGVEDIPEWALEEEKPEYTAEEVGAIAREDLQKAVNVALAQAKASGEFDGESGEDGEDGVSVVSVRQTTTSSADGGSNVITVTLSNGQTSTFTVKNGSKGSQGDKGDKGERGLQGVKGDTGAQGAKGDKGDTPVKGKDYYTEADKAEMVQAVLAMIPIYDGEVVAE